MPTNGSLNHSADRPPVPDSPGRHVYKGIPYWWCNCATYCKEMKWVSEACFYRHRRATAQQAPGSAATGPPTHSSSAANSTREATDALLERPPQSDFWDMDLDSDESMGLRQGGGNDNGYETPEEELADPVPPEPAPSSEEAAATQPAPTSDNTQPNAASTDPDVATADPEAGEEPLDNPDDPYPITSLAELQVALDFIAALKDAQLDKSGLPPEVVKQLQEPIESVLNLDDENDPNLRLSLEIYMATSNGSDMSYNKIAAALRRRSPDIELYSLDRLKRKIGRLTGLVPIVHDMCINSCMAYTGPFESRNTCFYCSAPRFNSQETRRQHFYTIPIGPQIQAHYAHPDRAEHMSYRKKVTQELISNHTVLDDHGHPKIDIPEYFDYLCGSDYLDAVASGKITDDDVVLLLSIDGAQLYEHKASDCWLYIWVLLDLPPSQRYKKKHVIPGGFIPGPNKPKNLDSFLFPGLYHLSSLQREGLRIWDAKIDRTFTSKPFWLFGTADGPGMIYLNGLVGHNGYIGCRLYCPIQGRRSSKYATKYYPVLLQPDDFILAGSDHPDVDPLNLCQASGNHHRYEEKLRYLLTSPNISQYKKRRLVTGISKPSIFSGLDKAHRLDQVLGSFPSDTMHLISLNITDLLLGLLRGTIDCNKDDDVSTWDWAVLTGGVWERQGKIVEQMRWYLPGSFDRPPRNPAKKISSGYKAREFLSYVYGMLVGLLPGVIPDRYFKNFCLLLRGIRLILQRTITKEEAQLAHESLVVFCLEFEELYVQRNPSRIHFVCYCIHNLIHLAPETVRIGPNSLVAQWTLERAIGYLTEELRQPSNPYHNLSERGLRRAQVNALLAMTDLEPPPKLPTGSFDYGDGYQLLAPTGKMHNMGDDEILAFSAFLNLADAPTPSYSVQTKPWGRLLLPTGQIARTAWKECAKSDDDPLRISRMVKIVTDGKPMFAEVAYFFQAQFDSSDNAMSTSDAEMVISSPPIVQDRLFIPIRYNPKDICNTSFPKYGQMKIKDRQAELKKARAEKRARSPDPFSEWDDEGPSSSTLRGDAVILSEVSTDVSSIKKELSNHRADLGNIKRSLTTMEKALEKVLEAVTVTQAPRFLYTKPAPSDIEKQKKLYWFREQWNAASKQESVTTIIDNEDVATGSSDLNQAEGRKVNRTMRYMVNRNRVPISGERAEYVKSLVQGKLNEKFLMKPHLAPPVAGQLDFATRAEICNAVEGEVVEATYCEGHWKTILVVQEIYSKWYSQLMKKQADFVKPEPVVDAKMPPPAAGHLQKKRRVNAGGPAGLFSATSSAIGTPALSGASTPAVSSAMTQAVDSVALQQAIDHTRLATAQPTVNAQATASTQPPAITATTATTTTSTAEPATTTATTVQATTTATTIQAAQPTASTQPAATTAATIAVMTVQAASTEPATTVAASTQPSSTDTEQNAAAQPEARPPLINTQQQQAGGSTATTSITQNPLNMDLGISRFFRPATQPSQLFQPLPPSTDTCLIDPALFSHQAASIDGANTTPSGSQFSLSQPNRIYKPKNSKQAGFIAQDIFGAEWISQPENLGKKRGDWALAWNTLPDDAKARYQLQFDNEMSSKKKRKKTTNENSVLPA